jgi:hypothetical protein
LGDAFSCLLIQLSPSQTDEKSGLRPGG